MNSPIKYFGGKGTMFNKIMEHFPNREDYDMYIEPFGGSFSIGLKMNPAKMEIYNDLEKNVYSLYKVLSDPDMFKRFKEKCDLIFYNDDIRKDFKDRLKDDNLSIEDRAFFFFYVNRTSHNGVGGFSINTYVRRNMSKSISDYLSSIDRLPELHDRLSRVVVSNMDGIELIKKHNNPRTFIYCVPENEIVLINNSPKKIFEVKEGDLCGRNNKVLFVNKRQSIGEKILKINVMGTGNKFPISISKDHIIFLYKNGKVIEEKGSNLNVGDYVIIEPYMTPENDTIENDINYIHKKSHTKQLQYNGNLPELSELLGFYAAEGHSQNGLIFSFNVKENDYLERVKALIKSVFNIDAKIYPNSPHSTVSQVRVHSVEIEHFFKENLINGTAKIKVFSDFVMNLSPLYQLEILKSWLKGDGGIWAVNETGNNITNRIRSGNRNKYKLTGTSASWNMINQLYQMALRCHLYPSIKPRGNAFDLYFTNKHDIEILTNIRTNGRSCKRRKWINNFMITPITKIEEIDYTGVMYDLTTEMHYFYFNFGIKSHNCDPPYEQSTRTSTRYKVDMDREGHLKFLDAVINSNSKILISGYDCPLYDELEKNGFQKIGFDVKTIGGNFKPKTKTEYLYYNYNIK